MKIPDNIRDALEQLGRAWSSGEAPDLMEEVLRTRDIGSAPIPW